MVRFERNRVLSANGISAKYGHLSSECDVNPTAVGGKACYRCGVVGHLSNQCTETGSTNKLQATENKLTSPVA